MSLEQDIATVRSLYDYFNTNDVEGLMSLITDDFELIDVAIGATWKGKQGWGEWLQNWAVSMPDAHIDLETVTGQGDMIVTEHTGSGTQTGPLSTPMGTIAPTGKTLKLSFAEFYVMRSGKIKTMRAYWDTGALMRQLGIT